MGLDAREETQGLSHEEQTRRTQLRGEIKHLAHFLEQSLVPCLWRRVITIHVSFIDWRTLIDKLIMLAALTWTVCCMKKCEFEFPCEFKIDSYNGEMEIWILDVSIENIKKYQLSYKVLAFPRRTKFNMKKLGLWNCKLSLFSKILCALYNFSNTFLYKIYRLEIPWLGTWIKKIK